MAGEALLWREGQPEWQAINAIPELQAAIASHSSNSEGYTMVSRAEAQAARQGAGSTIAAAAAPSAITGAPETRQDAELAAFQAELADIDPEAAAALGPTQPGIDARATPPPEDQRFEDDDGTVYVWDKALRKFVQEAVVSMPAYNADEMTFVPEEEKIPAMPPLEAEGDEGVEGPGTAQANGEAAAAHSSAAEEPKAAPQGAHAQPGSGQGSSKAADVIAKHTERGKRAREEEKKEWIDLKVNTSVYITGLPEDVSEAELAEVFSKCGVIKEADDRQPRVKIYMDKALNVAKGDGLVTFLKEPSVELACRILDGAQFRPGEGAAMTVQPAKFEMRGDEYIPRKRPANKKQKKAAAEAQEKALGWGGFDDQVKVKEVTAILMHMFDPKELQEAPGSQKELEADVKAECERLGPVQKVRVFTFNPQGAVSVKFKTPEAAQECVRKMNGRFFGGRQLEASMWDGITNYVVKKPSIESHEDEAARLEAFSAEIEAS